MTLLPPAPFVAPSTAQPARPQLRRLRKFVQDFSRLVESSGARSDDDSFSEAALIEAGQSLLADLVAHDDWLPEAYAQAHPDHYQQYLLFTDAQARFSVVSFVWGPGQRTPIHNHTVWGLVGLLRGEETAQAYAANDQGQWVASGPLHRLLPGQVQAVSPRIGDVHQVANGLSDATSISIHVYGANIGDIVRSVFSPSGQVKPFVSGYTNTQLPNLWDRT